MTATQDVVINGQPALLVSTEGTFGPGQFYLFQIDEATFLLFGTRVEVMQNPDVFGDPELDRNPPRCAGQAARDNTGRASRRVRGALP